ncbi:MAG TPA: DMT family transporter [Candidatus Sulfomarinibacteraceae bacterium]|nr:DMT family transporter [Candidatus Sulfomarinibacteraceae bacterium]
MTTFQFGIGERWALVAAVSYTIVNVMLRAAAPSIDSALGSLIRLVPVLVVAWFFVLRDGALEFRPSQPAFIGWRFVALLVLGGTSSFVLGNILYFGALREGGLGIAVGGVHAGVVIGGLWMGAAFQREPPRREQLAGAGLIVLGLGAIGLAQSGGSVADVWWLGLLFAVGAGTTYAAANAISRSVQRRRPLVFVTLAASSLGGFVPLAIMIAIRELSTPGSVPADPGSAGAVFMAGFANALALGGLAVAVRHAPVASVNTISSSSVVLSFAASVLVFGETGSAPMVAGMILVVAGILVAQLRRGVASGTAGS